MSSPPPAPNRPRGVIGFVDRLVLVAFAAVLAAIAALVVGVMGLANHDFGQELTATAELLGLKALATLLDGTAVEDIGAMIQQAATAALAIWLAPIALVAVIGETMGKASWMFYAVGMALAFAVAPMVMSLNILAIMLLYRALLGLLAIGIVAGTVYWLVAGRSAVG
ncbi:hypothetical protein BA190_18570 [Labrys sp. WJW]|uniref:hypothetical protein n=1 Tax=Labrys sp. WJW TaxID=1737983 RepID=UPI000833BC9E|nr:hypothetical protein [Labrys sp. WJW]OCC03473.1 hypothetical protein BA190_18570 [Labrys sp. WJW]